MIKALQTPVALRVEFVADLAYFLVLLERKENFLSSAKLSVFASQTKRSPPSPNEQQNVSYSILWDSILYGLRIRIWASRIPFLEIVHSIFIRLAGSKA
jgi:hypothetical protein